MSSHTAIQTSQTSSLRQFSQSVGLGRLWPALCAALLGLVVLYGAGFAPQEAHNVAHDTRHAAGFPCH
jgi:cobalt transporter subunit CbtB